MTPIRPSTRDSRGAVAIGGLTGLLVAGVLLLSACGGGAAGPDPGPAPIAPPDGPAAVHPGAPGEGSRILGPDERATVRLAHTEADVRFMQNMIHHHVQALQMSRLAEDRASSEQIRLLAGRIDRSQLDEIALMERWLEKRSEPVPEWREHVEHHRPGDPGHPGRDHAPHDRVVHEHHAHHHAHRQDDDALMAGMLTPEQLAELAAAEGEEFDRLFLEYMIFHHDGALQMVAELFAAPGAGQDSEIFRFASHVDADQRMEIARMERMLQERR